MENMGCQCLILKTWGCRGGVSQLNDGGCSFWGGRKCHFYSSKSTYSISQKLKKKMYSVLNDAALTNSYRLGFFDLGSDNFQFDPYSSDFV
jgi:hypothetical protein